LGVSYGIGKVFCFDLPVNQIVIVEILQCVGNLREEGGWKNQKQNYSGKCQNRKP